MGCLKKCVVHRLGKSVLRTSSDGRVITIIAAGIILVKRSLSWRKYSIVIGTGIVGMPRSIANDFDMRCQEYPPHPTLSPRSNFLAVRGV